MNDLAYAVREVVAAQKVSTKPLAIVLAGHNGSGKSTMWYRHLAPLLKIPLINADRMMMSILPDVDSKSRKLPPWAQKLRDGDVSWQSVAQLSVQSFTAHAMAGKVPFAMETVFSYWHVDDDGTVHSKIDLIRDMQRAGYFVLLVFVGLSTPSLSIARVLTRVGQGGHSVDPAKLETRFPRTQKAITQALPIVDAAILVDNSRGTAEAFTVCLVQLGENRLYDWRSEERPVPPPPAVLEWLNKVAP